MSRAATIGNGNLLVGLNERGLVCDLYFPYVGHSNHISGASGSYLHRVGVYVEGVMSWIDDPVWQVNVFNENENYIVNVIEAHNQELGIKLTFRDVVHNEKDVLIRMVDVTNTNSEPRVVKVFFSQQFRISESRRGDTGFYDPRVGALIHYKGRYSFLINAFHKKRQFKDFSIGLFDIEGKEGTYKDANDGILEKNPIEHGSVDSVIGLDLDLGPLKTETINYWIACGRTIAEVHQIDKEVIDETPEALFKSTVNYWQAWLDKEDIDLKLFSRSEEILYKKSLLVMRMHCDNRGGIIASSDTAILHHGRDTYSYVWPRDGAFIAHSLDRNGYNDVAERYYEFISARLESGGYLMHKYRSDGVLGSSWHPWLQEGKMSLPIQEDETAITIYMLFKHYELTKNIEFIESLYNPFIEPATNFLCDYFESAYGLPTASYDLWEENYAISTYTASSVYGALCASVALANELGKDESARTYSAIAQRLKESILTRLFDPELGMFVKSAKIDEEGDLVLNRTLDMSSFFGPLYFGVIEVDDPRVEQAYKVIERELKINANSQGFIRYQGDNYYKMSDVSTPNPWVITTLWVAQFLIQKAKTLKQLESAREIIKWTTTHASPSGMLSEQMHPHTRVHLSTAPLIWSHSEYVVTVNDYLKKYSEIKDKVNTKN